jgi:hypothetical protein
MCFFNSAEKANFEQSEGISTLKTLIGSQYSFLKVTQFSQENNVLDVPASNFDCCLSRDTCVTQFSHENNVLHHPASNLDGFFQEIHVFLQLSRIGPFGTN